jgi:hypothetical protein
LCGCKDAAHIRSLEPTHRWYAHRKTLRENRAVGVFEVVMCFVWSLCFLAAVVAVVVVVVVVVVAVVVGRGTVCGPVPPGDQHPPSNEQRATGFLHPHWR